MNKAMNKYERGVSVVAGSIITTAQQASDVFVNVALAVIAIVSTMPEIQGILHTSNSSVLAIAVGITGAGSAHTAVRTKNSLMWGIFAVHLIVVECILYFQGGVSELAYPIFTIVGAAVMSISQEHRTSIEMQNEEVKDARQLEREQIEFEREQQRLDNEAKRRLAIEKQRAKLQSSTVAPTVASTVSCDSEQSSDTVGMRQSKLIDMLQQYATPDEINKTRLARELGVSRHTIIRDIESLEATGKLHLNGRVEIRK